MVNEKIGVNKYENRKWIVKVDTLKPQALGIGLVSDSERKLREMMKHKYMKI